MQLLRIVTLTAVGLSSIGCNALRARPLSAGGGVRPDARELATVEQIADSYNQNSRKIDSIVCNSVTIDGKATDPQGKSNIYTLDAMLGYQKPDNFRMKGFFMKHAQVDLGSNSNEIWFWIKQMDAGRVFYLNRADLARAEVNIPFQPDWLAEVLGAKDIDAAQYRLDRNDRDYYSIKTRSQTPAGFVDKEIIFKRANNRMYAMQLRNSATDALIAQAIVDEYWEDSRSGLFCPRVVRMNWPEAGSSMTVKLGRGSIRVNDLSEVSTDILFTRDGLSNKEAVNVARLQPPPGNQPPQPAVVKTGRSNAGYGPRREAILAGHDLELGVPRVVGQ